MAPTHTQPRLRVGVETAASGSKDGQPPIPPEGDGGGPTGTGKSGRSGTGTGGSGGKPPGPPGGNPTPVPGAEGKNPPAPK
eukprot:14167860-Heterocapsa_arctica.AAC.1